MVSMTTGQAFVQINKVEASAVGSATITYSILHILSSDNELNY